MKYIIRYNYGYGDVWEEIEAENMEEADKYAYEAWREGVEDNSDFSAYEYTEELANDYL